MESVSPFTPVENQWSKPNTIPVISRTNGAIVLSDNFILVLTGFGDVFA